MKFLDSISFVLFGIASLSSVAVALENTPECQEFERYAVGQIGLKQKAPQSKKDFDHAHPVDENTQGFNTDGLVVLKDGKVVYEFYDGDPKYGGSDAGLYLRDTPHSLWSASKTVTATLVGRALFESMKVNNGEALTLETPLDQILPRILTPETQVDQNAHFYSDVKIKNLLDMSSNFKWDENYESGLRQSSFLPMLYFKNGHADMLKYALSQPMQSEGPGTRWNYSGGNSMILLGILKDLSEQAAKDSFAKLPWTLLFDRLQMEGAVFERDEKGVFIGNSYVYLRPIDMAAIGQLYLDGGNYAGHALLDPTWIKEAQELSPAESNPQTPLDYIHEEGVYSKRAFWLNQRVPREKNDFYGPEFPTSPSDMYFAAGHYGQLIIVLPSQHMVIARTGHDTEYWSRLNRFVSKTVACFSPNEGSKP